MTPAYLAVVLGILSAGGTAGVKKATLRVMGAQIAVTRDAQANAATIKRAIDHAIAEKADVLLTPEGSLSGYFASFDQKKVAPLLAEVTKKAKDGNLGLVLGTCLEESDGKRYNEQRFYEKDGTYLGFHAKNLRCKNVYKMDSAGEIDQYAGKPLGTFQFGGLKVGGLICNDMWADPEWTPQDDTHLSQQLARMGARIVFHSVNSGYGQGDNNDLFTNFHESNLRLRARAGKLWIVVANAADPKGQGASNTPSGVIGPDGKWRIKANRVGEQFFNFTIEPDST